MGVALTLFLKLKPNESCDTRVCCSVQERSREGHHCEGVIVERAQDVPTPPDPHVLVCVERALAREHKDCCVCMVLGKPLASLSPFLHS